MNNFFEVKYTETPDGFLFDITPEGALSGEYALLFTDGTSRYTAGIFKCENTNITVAPAKTYFADKVLIVNIDSDRKMFEIPWNEKPVEESIALSDISKQKESLSEDDDSSVKDADFICDEFESEEVKPQNQTPDIASVINKFLDAFANAKESKALPEFPFVQKKSSDVAFEDVYERFISLNLPNHKFYIFSENANVRVRFGDEYISAESLFLGYSNKILSDYPDRILGTAWDSAQNRYNVFGVLGENKSAHCPFDGVTGYKYYRSIPDSDLGYWLMYLNAETGAVCAEL